MSLEWFLHFLMVGDKIRGRIPHDIWKLYEIHTSLFINEVLLEHSHIHKNQTLPSPPQKKKPSAYFYGIMEVEEDIKGWWMLKLSLDHTLKFPG